jgi:hypothetical protein
MCEVTMPLTTTSFNSEPPLILSRRKHLPSHCRRKRALDFPARPSAPQLHTVQDRNVLSIAQPEPSPGKRAARPARLGRMVRHRRLGHSVLRKRLLISTASHPDRRQHEIMHQLGKSLAGHVFEQNLRDDKAATGISPIVPGECRRSCSAATPAVRPRNNATHSIMLRAARSSRGD